MKKLNKNSIKEKIKNHDLYQKGFRYKKFSLIFIIIIIYISYNYFNHGFIYDMTNNSLDETINFIQGYGDLSWIIYLFLIILEVILVAVPGFILNAAGGIAFGPFLGGLLTLVGNVIGATICFFLAKKFAGNYFETLIGEKRFAQFHKYSDKYGIFVLFILRLNPLTSSDIFSYLAGFIEMSYKRFIIATTLVLIPLVFIIIYFGELFIKKSPFLKLFFLIIALIYILIFVYGYYKIGKAKFKAKLEKFRK